MKDYSNGAMPEFILNYKIEGNNIIINHADGSVSTVEYTKENEDKMLKDLRRQINLYHQSKETCEWQMKNFKNIFLVLLLALIIGFIFIGNPIEMGFAIISFTFLSMFDLYLVLKTKKYLKEITKDYEKIEFFLENQKLINEKVKSYTNQEKSISLENEKCFNINMIDNMSYEDLKQLVELVKDMENAEEIIIDNQKTIKFKK